MKFSKLPRIYIEDQLNTGIEILVPPQHGDYILRVLRLKNNDEIRVFNEQYGEFIAQIKIIKSSKISLIITKSFRQPNLTSRKLTLGIGVIKNSNFTEVIKGAIQLGVRSFLPIFSEFSQHYEINYEKIKNIIIEALRQSERIDMPEIMPVVKLNQLNLHNYSSVIYANEHETENNLLSVKNSCNFENPLLFIGPEGGLSQSDLDYLKGFSHTYSVSLGENVLRSEIASFALLAQFNLVANYA